MEFQQVVQACLDYSITNNGTIQVCPAGGPDWLQVQSRTTRTAILVERGSGTSEWRLEQLQDATGEETHSSATVSTVEELQTHLRKLWDKAYTCTID